MRSIFIIFTILLSGCSIFYSLNNEQQEVLSEFIEYLYENKKDFNLDSLQNFSLIKINFLDLKYLNEHGLKEMLNKHTNGIELCNKYREISFRNGKNKTIWMYYHVKNTNYYLTFVFDTDIEETYYEFSTFFERESFSCELQDLQRVITVPE